MKVVYGLFPSVNNESISTATNLKGP